MPSVESTLPSPGPFALPPSLLLTFSEAGSVSPFLLVDLFSSARALASRRKEPDCIPLQLRAAVGQASNGFSRKNC